MELSQLISLVDSGQYETLLQAIEMVGFQSIGIEIPIGLGFSVTIYVTKDSILELAHTKLERYALEKLYDKGGAIRVDLTWAEHGNIACGAFYFNKRLGLVLIFAGLIELLPEPILKILLINLNTLASTNRHNCYTDIVEMRNFVKWFDDLYYQGVLETGKDPSFIGKYLRFKQY